jgi:hypothetical protein
MPLQDEEVLVHDDYECNCYLPSIFCVEAQCCNMNELSNIKKCTTTLQMLAYRVAFHVIDEYV